MRSQFSRASQLISLLYSTCSGLLTARHRRIRQRRWVQTREGSWKERTALQGHVPSEHHSQLEGGSVAVLQALPEGLEGKVSEGEEKRNRSVSGGLMPPRKVEEKEQKEKRQIIHLVIKRRTFY